MMGRQGLLLAGAVIAVAATAAWPAGDAQEGFGTPAGAPPGAPRVVVTSTADKGPGTLREVLSRPGSRRVVFAVGGAIVLRKHILVRDRTGITIDGGGAPAPGVTLVGNGLKILDSNNVLVRDLRVRGARTDGIAVTGSSHVVVDHCSTSDAGDENMSITEGSHDVTVSWSLIGDTRADPALRAKGMLIANFKRPAVTRVTLHHNLFTGESQRSPQVSTDGLFDIRNNVIRGWFSYGIRMRRRASGNIVNNVLASERRPEQAVVLRPDAGAVWLDGNLGPAAVDPNRLRTAPGPFAVAPVDTQPAAMAAARVVAEAGARPRDAVDAGLAR